MNFVLPRRFIRTATGALLLASSACQPPAPAVSHPNTEANAGSAPSLPTARAGGYVPAAQPSREGWNRAQIEWITYDQAVERARTEHKPICVVMHADWCPHCHNYAHVFEDPRVVANARRMLMVLLNVDEQPQVAGRFALDGPYVPRTYFVGADGNAMADIDAHRPQYRYFFSENDPGSILGGMEAALARR